MKLVFFHIYSDDSIASRIRPIYPPILDTTPQKAGADLLGTIGIRFPKKTDPQRLGSRPFRLIKDIGCLKGLGACLRTLINEGILLTGN